VDILLEARQQKSLIMGYVERLEEDEDLSLPLTRTQLFASFDFSQTQSNFAFEFV
jgi:hypothetical protein